MGNNRIQYFDVLRGLAIIMVVAQHVTTELSMSTQTGGG